MEIIDCPSIEVGELDFLGHMKSPKTVVINNCSSLSSVSVSNVKESLWSVEIIECNNLRVVEQLPSGLSSVSICDCKNLFKVKGSYDFQKFDFLDFEGCLLLEDKEIKRRFPKAEVLILPSGQER